MKAKFILTLRPKLSQRGASLVEYALLVALIAISTIVAVDYVGETLFASFWESSQYVKTGCTNYNGPACGN